jgi:hypothetical protein
MNAKLKAKCRENPEAIQPVVITVEPDVVGENLAEIGLGEAEPIVGVPGLFKSRLTGERLLELADKPYVKEIVEDAEIRMF